MAVNGGYSVKSALCPCSPFSLKCHSTLLKNLLPYDTMAGRRVCGEISSGLGSVSTRRNPRPREEAGGAQHPWKEQKPHTLCSPSGERPVTSRGNTTAGSRADALPQSWWNQAFNSAVCEVRTSPVGAVVGHREAHTSHLLELITCSGR